MRYLEVFALGIAVGFYLRGKLKKLLPTKEGIVDQITRQLFGPKGPNDKKGGK